ncbi:8-amino-7-oxononanoate synthase [Geitlerinema calcuttense]|uniref:8-amino-7-ketopelargonate synthase n=1 Tax=Geitlerinema calcuttense NRMC-F 0142 TaxID=2922238 RepID=A0ABT7LWC6_9CYAN|nr:8-amino-7-oxononanoate synthase [Geitlerinema calcuttense]MDL5056069.1 8-amino-7-oxononanoate synthase [Geitlerinema calcuttense NRMC-F 0142]
MSPFYPLSDRARHSPPTTTEPYAWLASSLETIHQANWYRSVQPLDSLPGCIVQSQGQSWINFASNDYLGLAGDPRLIAAAIAATRAWGTGSTGSRLLTGHRPLHRQLEEAIAQLKQTEDALVFSSGYLANLGAIAAVVGKRDLILSDRYNHSSLKNGAILSGATIQEYQHLDLADLTLQLQQHRQHYRRCLIVTDSVFSMDGDVCPLPQLLDLATEYNSMLLIDEAHATGVFGESGAGCAEYFNCTGKPMIQVGTLSKALGSLGGYVAGSAPLIDFLRNRAPSWIYTTALTPADTAAALAAVEICRREPQRRQQLWQNVAQFKHLLATQLPQAVLLPSDSPILCLQLANPAQALQVGHLLKQAGIFAPAIRPPTVTTSRIRISLMATHTSEQLQQLVDALQSMEIYS